MWRKLLGCLVALLTVLLSVLPGFGPVLDHHFAERQPDHAHIYFGLTLFQHIHPFEEPHGHTHGQEAEVRAGLKPAPTGDNSSSGAAPYGIVYLTSYQGMGQSFSSPCLTSIHPAIIFPDLGNNWFAFGTPGENPILLEAFIAPPERPPRA